jgi:hypothetical protein
MVHKQRATSAKKAARQLAAQDNITSGEAFLAENGK